MKDLVLIKREVDSSLNTNSFKVKNTNIYLLVKFFDIRNKYFFLHSYIIEHLQESNSCTLHVSVI